MNGGADSDRLVRDYLDALLQTPASEPGHEAGAAAPPDAANWQLCTLGRLHLLLPADAVGPAVPCAGLPAPAAGWHLASVDLDAVACRVVELARCVAPGAEAAVDTLLPVTGSRWALAVGGRPQPLHLPAEAIEWRPQRSSRPWLVGMSRDRRHMALDVHALIAQVAGDAGHAMEEPSS